MVDTVYVLDMFSGLGGGSQAFLDRGHTVLRIDNDPEFGSVPFTRICNVFELNLHPSIQPDVIWASPPCECFSVASIGTYWDKETRTPKHPKAELALKILVRTFEIIERYPNAIFFVENPRAMMRTLTMMQKYPRHTVTYCQYGRHYMKPTDIWSNSTVWKPRAACKNGGPCHERAPRGSRKGVQGVKGAAERAIVPYELSLEVCKASEREVTEGLNTPSSILFHDSR